MNLTPNKNGQVEIKGEDLEQLRKVCLESTYAFGKVVCGFADLDPDVHARMAEWEERDSRFKLGMAPRGFLKTSTWTIAGNLRRVTKDPNLRVLLVNETQLNTSKWIGLMQDIVQSPLYRALYPDRVPDPLKVRWNSTQLELQRKAKWPEPTIEGIGVGGASTSNHYNRIINDDLVGKEARESPSVMEKAWDQRKLSWSLLVDASKSEICDYCTRWHPDDVAARSLKTVQGLDVFTMPLRKEDGSPMWPKRYPDEVIQQIRAEQGVEMFALQYENRVVGGGASKFDPGLLRYWTTGVNDEGENVFKLEQPGGREKEVKIENCLTFQIIDAGLSPESKDARTANVVAALTPPAPGEPFDIIILEAKATKSTPYQVIQESKATYDRWNPMLAAIETFGGHEAFFYWINATFPDMRIRKLDKDFSRNAKHKRIIGFWGSYPSQGRVYIHRSAHVDLVEELISYPNGKTVDLLDAAGYLPTVWCPPNPIKPVRTRPAGVTDFDIADYSEEEIRQMVNDGYSEVTGY